MPSIINASSTGSGGIVQTADASGVLQLQSNGTVGLVVSGANVGIGGTPSGSYNLEVAGNFYANNITLPSGGTTIGTGSLGSVSGAALQLFGVGSGTLMTLFANGVEGLRLNSSGNVGVRTGSAIYGTLTVNGNIAPIAAPSANWGIDFGTTTSAGSYVTLANGATYDLAAGAGFIWVFEQSSAVGICVASVVYGAVYIVSNPQNAFTTTAGTGSKTNIYYNSGTGTYRIQNNSGATYSYWIATMRVRNSS